MCDVDKENLGDLYPVIEDAIRNCDFIALDTEFTVLVGSAEDKPSLFDDMETRYRKSRNSMSKAAICQLGLSTFQKNPKDYSQYEAKTFNFYLFPQSMGVIDTKFTCQASSMSFLVRYQFDFNKFIYKGISYMNEVEEEQLRNHLNMNKMFSGLERSLDEEGLQEICSSVADWLTTCKEEEELWIPKTDFRDISPYIIKKELMLRFPNLTVLNRKTLLQISKKTVAEKDEANERSNNGRSQSEQEVLDRMLGFTRVFRVLKECRKPLIGHNMFLDLLLVFDKFHQPLPAKYSDFKSELHSLFPVIFDTKHLINTKRREFEHTGLFNKTMLEHLYRSLSSREGLEVVIHQPNIQQNKEFNKYEITDANLPHEAGWDAYMCGYVFLRFAHILTFVNTKSGDVTPCTFQRYLSELSNFVNRVNLIRGHISNICLDGPDPVTRRPDLLYLTHRKLWQTIDIEQVAKLMSGYGSVDVRPLGRSRALIAAGNHMCVRDILKAFQKNKVYHVTTYRMWKHSRVAQGLLWSGVLVSSGVCAWVLLTSNKKQ